MSGELRRAADELRVIRAARRNGRRLRVASELTESPLTRDRESFLLALLGLAS